MKPNKRGEAGETIKYLLIAIIIIFILWFGFTTIQKIDDAQCQSELTQFIINIENIGGNIKHGTVEEKTLLLPCNANQIIFSENGNTPDSYIQQQNPIIADSIISGAQNNVFLQRDNKLITSIKTNELDLSVPDYICMIPRSERINFFVEGKGKTINIIPGCNQPTCTYQTEQLANQEAIQIIKEAYDYGQEPQSTCTNCPTNIEAEWDNYVQTQANIEVLRKYELCRDPGRTIVEITVQPKESAIAKNIRLYEYIPKECISSLQAFLTEYTQGTVSIKDDPLIVWSLDEVEEKAQLSYTLDTVLSEECRDKFDAISIAETIQGGITVPDVPTPPYCGDGTCQPTETCTTCSQDCTCPAPQPVPQPTPTPNPNPPPPQSLDCSLLVDCTDYGNDQTTCTNDPCGFADASGSCSWNGLSCEKVQSCTDAPGCTTTGLWDCTTTTSYRICGDYDADSCLEWGTTQTCPANTECNAQTRTCESTNQQQTCDGSDTSCGTWPNCQNCNLQDGLYGNNFCSGGNIVKEYRNYRCNTNTCTYTPSNQIQIDCQGLGCATQTTCNQPQTDPCNPNPCNPITDTCVNGVCLTN